MNLRPILTLAATSLVFLTTAACEDSGAPPNGSISLNTQTPSATFTAQATPKASLTATSQPAPTAIPTATREPIPTPQPTIAPEPTANAAPTATPVQAAGSGIQGQALMGPTCPVVRIDEPCPDQPVQVTVDVLNADCTHKITAFTTDADGRFRIALQPGEYCLVPQPGAGGFPFGKPQNVVVEENAYTGVIISLDTGIR